MAQQSITLANYSDIQQLQSNMATIETTSTASKAYEIGEYLVYGGQLYIVTDAIALGDTLTIGTNIATTTIGSGKVNTTGDTMTGDLTIGKSDPRLYTKNPDIDMTEADNGVSVTTYNGIRNYDANGKDMGCIYSSATAAGLSRTGLWAYNYDTNGDLVGNNSFTVQVTKAGDLTYSMASPANFCTAIGVGARIYKEVGSSGTMAIPSSTATALTNISMTAGTWLVIGQVAFQGGSSSNAGSYRRCHIGTSSTGTQIAAQAVPGTIAGNTQVQAIGIRVIASTQTTYLSCQQGSGADINVSKSGSWILAIKIGAQTT